MQPHPLLPLLLSALIHSIFFTQLQLNKKSMILKPWEVAPLGSIVKAYVHEVDARRKRIGLTTYAPEQWNDMLPMKVTKLSKLRKLRTFFLPVYFFTPSFLFNFIIPSHFHFFSLFIILFSSLCATLSTSYYSSTVV